MRDALSGIGLLEKRQDPIDYHERPPLVMPPKIDGKALPQPRARSTSTAWPKDPEIVERERAAVERRNPKGSQAQGRYDDNNATLSVEEMRGEPPRRAGLTTTAERKPGDNNRDDSLLSPFELLKGKSANAGALRHRAEPRHADGSADRIPAVAQAAGPAAVERPDQQRQPRARGVGSPRVSPSARAAVTGAPCRRCNGAAAWQHETIVPVRFLRPGDQDGPDPRAHPDAGRFDPGPAEGKRNAPVQEGDAHPLPAASGLALRRQRRPGRGRAVRAFRGGRTGSDGLHPRQRPRRGGRPRSPGPRRHPHDLVPQRFGR